VRPDFFPRSVPNGWVPAVRPRSVIPYGLAQGELRTSGQAGSSPAVTRSNVWPRARSARSSCCCGAQTRLGHGDEGKQVAAPAALRLGIPCGHGGGRQGRPPQGVRLVSRRSLRLAQGLDFHYRILPEIAAISVGYPAFLVLFMMEA